MQTRREFLAAAALAQRGRANVLVVMSDQESALLPGPADLPNRKRLEKGGVTFTSAFCNTPQCSAARSALLTGLRPHQTGVLANVDTGSLGKPLSPKLPTVGSVFRSAGYQTGYFGKWHLGGRDLGKFGFDQSVLTGTDEAVAGQAASWIRGQSGPWLAWVSLINPHDIYGLPQILHEVKPRPGVRPPATGLRNLAGKPPEQQAYVDKDHGRPTRDFRPEDWIRYRSHYLDLVEKVDRLLGVVLDAAPQLDATIVAYTSDHGDALGEHGLSFKGPFMYEELIRIPFILRAPGLASGVRNELMTQADLAPTLASLAGVPWPSAISGRDLSRGGGGPDAVFLEYYSKQKWVNPIRTIRTKRWKLNWYDSGSKELYDLVKDPREEKNLAGQAEARAVQVELEKRIDGWRGPSSAC